MIRAYADSDLDDVLDAWYEASIIAHSFLTEEFFDTERALLAERWLPVAETYVYEVDGRVVGFAALAGDDELGGLFVHPDHQGRGIGRALVDHARASRPFLDVEVFVENEIGRRFYAAYGFEQVGASVEPQTGQQQLRLRYRR